MQGKTSEILTSYLPQYHSPNLQTFFGLGAAFVWYFFYQSFWEERTTHINQWAQQKTAEKTCHPCQYPLSLHHIQDENHIKCLIIFAAWVRGKSSSWNAACFKPPTRTVSEAHTKMWSFLEAASSHALPAKWLLIWTFIPAVHWTSSFCPPLHSKSGHFLHLAFTKLPLVGGLFPTRLILCFPMHKLVWFSDSI